MVPEDEKPTPSSKNELDLQSPDVQSAWARIAARAAVDEPFLERLRASPAEVFAEFGVTLDRKVDLNKDFSPSLDEILASAERQRAASPDAFNNSLRALSGVNGSVATSTANPFCGCMCQGTVMTAALGNAATPVSDAGAGVTTQAIPPCVGTATQPCSQMCSCMCYPCIAATPLSPADARSSELAVNRVSSGTTFTNATVSGCFCGQFCSTSATNLPAAAEAAVNRVGSSSMQTNATVSGCFCGQFCSTSSTMMSTPLENRMAGSQGAGATGMQDAITSNRSAGTMATAFCMECQACACYGTNGGCWGSFPVCAATLGVGGAQTIATSGGTSSTMSSTPLSGGGSLSSYGSYGSAACRPVFPHSCRGTLGSMGTLSGCSGTVSSVGCY